MIWHRNMTQIIQSYDFASYDFVIVLHRMKLLRIDCCCDAMTMCWWYWANSFCCCNELKLLHWRRGRLKVWIEVLKKSCTDLWYCSEWNCAMQVEMKVVLWIVIGQMFLVVVRWVFLFNVLNIMSRRLCMWGLRFVWWSLKFSSCYFFFRPFPCQFPPFYLAEIS